jgi:hypothetical protein
MSEQFESIQIRTFKTFLNFSFLILLLSITFFTILSSKYRVSDYQIIRTDNSYLELNLDSLETIKGGSIWLINDSDFEKLKLENSTIDTINYTKNLPNNVIIEIKEFEAIASITDLRNSIPKNTILFKNQIEINKNTALQDLPTVTVSNGPVANNFSGELVSFFVTLKKFNLRVADFSLVHNGTSLIGEFRGLQIFFGQPVDLGIKASVLGDFLNSKTCTGEVRFLSSEEIVSDC